METENLNIQKLQELERRNEEAMRGGGEARVSKHKQGGRLTARERLDVLLDPGSFVERIDSSRTGVLILAWKKM
jgi:acetyl-CoA carboxylase carboxyltransferase component